MNRDQKAAVIDRVAEEIGGSEAIFAVDYRGISVKQASELRGSLAEAGTSFRIVKNTLTERAADQAGAETLKELLEGPTALAFVHGDIALAAKALANFRRSAGLLVFKGGRMGGEALTVEQMEALARLPARDVLNQQFVGVLASPLTGLVRGLAALVSGLAVALRQIEEQGLLSASAGKSPSEGAGGGDQPDAPVAGPDSAGGQSDAAEAAPEGDAPGGGGQSDAANGAPAAAGGGPDAGQEPDSPASEAPGDPVAEAEAVEQASNAPSAGDQTQEG